MALHTASDLSAAEFREALGVLGQHRIARLFSVSPRHVRRWRDSTRHVPPGIRIIFHLLTTRVITTDQVEQAATAISEPPAPVEPVSAPAALACAEAAAHADPGSTTVAAVLALRETNCRWPIGDPGSANFRFCSDPVVAPPYCERHRAAAYMARRELIRPPPVLGSSAPWLASQRPS
jgi:hypothetical protein